MNHGKQIQLLKYLVLPSRHVELLHLRAKVRHLVHRDGVLLEAALHAAGLAGDDVPGSAAAGRHRI